VHQGVTSSLLSVQGLVKDYVTRDVKLRQQTLRAVDGVDFEVGHGETFAVVGESGSGKSTLGRLILRLTDATEGAIEVLGDDVTNLRERDFRRYRRDLQVVFQNPYLAFNPRATIRASLRDFAELKGLHRRGEQNAAIDRSIREVGLQPGIAERKPAEVSGGQLQRLSIARALLVEPQLLFLDEPTSSLDVSIRGQIVNLLLDRQDRDNLSFLLVAHDLRVVHAMAHRVAVMYLGQFVEVGSRDQVYERARHPYTRGLLTAADLDVPATTTSQVRLSGELTSADTSDTGCRLLPRCPFAEDRCRLPQTLEPVEAGHLVRCWKAVEQPQLIELTEPVRRAAS
jgi:peptide/nickel transport system ATP-binding protein